MGQRDAVLQSRVMRGGFPSLERSLWVTGLIAGATTLGLGLIVIVGWYTDNRTLIQVLPKFVPMQFNTALGFVLSGGGLIAMTIGLVIGLVMLQNPPHAFDIVLGVTPVALGIQVAQVDLGIETELDTGHGVGDFPRDELEPAPR